MDVRTCGSMEAKRALEIFRSTPTHPFSPVCAGMSCDQSSGISYPQRSTKRPQAFSTVARTSAS